MDELITNLSANLTANRLVATSVIAIILLLGIAWAAARMQTARRTHELVAALNDSTRGRMAALRGPNAGGYAGKLEPAPEPFIELRVDYRAAAPYDLVGQLLAVVTKHGDRLQVTGKLPVRPAAEIIWQKGHAPGYALARRERQVLWVLRRLDIADAEYAVRGSNTNAIEHVFLDLQARFGPYLEQIGVQTDMDPELKVVMRLGDLNLREIPALVTSLRGLGRAALRD